MADVLKVHIELCPKHPLSEAKAEIQRLHGEVAELLAMRDADALIISQAGRDITNLKAALEESVKLQAHYAKLLNMHDGGQRIQFKSADEWLARLERIEKAKDSIDFSALDERR